MSASCSVRPKAGRVLWNHRCSPKAHTPARWGVARRAGRLRRRFSLLPARFKTRTSHRPRLGLALWAHFSSPAWKDPRRKNKQLPDFGGAFSCWVALRPALRLRVGVSHFYAGKEGLPAFFRGRLCFQQLISPKHAVRPLTRKSADQWDAFAGRSSTAMGRLLHSCAGLTG